MGRDGGSDGARWQGYSHQELYDMLHSGPGPAASGGVADQWSELASALTDIQQQVNAGVRGSGASWVGAAGDAARSALGPLGEWAQQASTAADVMRISTELQGDLLSKARAAMPAPVPVPQQPGRIGQLLSAQIDYEVAELASQVAEQQAYQVMAQYEAATDDNTSTLGDFGEPPTLVVDTTPITGPVVRSPVDSPAAAGDSSRPRVTTTPVPETEESPSSRRATVSPRTPVDEAPVEGAEEAGSVVETPAEPGFAAGGAAPNVATTPSGATPTTTAPTPDAQQDVQRNVHPDVRPEFGPRSEIPATSPSSFDPVTVDSAATPTAIPVSRDRDSSGSRFPGGAIVPAARRADDGDDPDDVHVSKYLIEADDIYGDPQTYAPPVIGESPRRR